MPQLNIHGVVLQSNVYIPSQRNKTIGRDLKMALIEENMLQSGFWKADELKEEQTAEIMSEFEVTATDYGNRMQGKLKIGKETKSITFNNTSTKTVAKKYGNDTKKWQGKTVIIKKLAQMVSGKERQILYVFTK